MTKIFGTQNLETAEDVVQQTFIDAISVWKLKGIPDNPSAWLFRVAKNKTIDIIRRNKHSVQYDFSDNERVLLTSEYTLASTIDILWNEDALQDDMLRMMFACCNPIISVENQITLILKTLCGFSTSEIAKAFLTTEETISKRLFRTKELFRQHKIKVEFPSDSELKKRTNAVLNSIYLLFNEGYNSSNSEELIRKDLIAEAMLLCKLLTENKITQIPETFALMALMCFHSSRIDSRLTHDGDIILLNQQDRSTWNYKLIAEGNEYLNKAAFGTTISTYHLEAAIAFEHCVAAKFEDTNWKRILELYDWLCKLQPSEVTELNRIVVILRLKGSAAALAALQNLNSKNKLDNYYLYHSLLGVVYTSIKDKTTAKYHFEKAIRLTKSDKEKKLLQDKIGSLMIEN
ncbi:MAG: sigma-70 family RNA polymerase sigma factor [Ignavibacteria bacterium]|nr:sigma-70 family RNA polymerase sigma factor [Ignavibacteria bacterium]